MPNTIIRGLAANFIRNRVDRNECLGASQHVGLLPLFGTSSSVWISIGGAVPPLRSCECPHPPRPTGIGRDLNSGTQMIIVEFQDLE